MIQVRGERVKVVRMACGYRFKLKPEYAGVTGKVGSVVNRDQLETAVREYYLEGK